MRSDAHYPDLRLVADLHVPLLDALHRKDVERCVAMMEQHLQGILHDALTLAGPRED